MIAKVADVKAAKAKMVEGALTIWNARLDAMLEAGNVQGAIDHMAAPAEDVINNCDCNTSCGGVTPPGELVRTLRTTAKK